MSSSSSITAPGGSLVFVSGEIVSALIDSCTIGMVVSRLKVMLQWCDDM